MGFPAEVNPEEEPGGLFKTGVEHHGKSANLASNVWSNLRAAWKLEGDLRGNDAKSVCRALFRYCVAIAHAPQYESDHKDLLAHDWPHIPLAKEKEQFDKTVMLGEEVTQLLDPLADPSPILKALLGDDAKTLGVVQRNGGGSISESELRFMVQNWKSAWKTFKRPSRRSINQRPTAAYPRRNFRTYSTRVPSRSRSRPLKKDVFWK